MAKQECYYAMMRLVTLQNLTTPKKLAKILKVKEKEAKSLLAGDLKNYDQADIIRFTGTLITTRLFND